MLLVFSVAVVEVSEVVGVDGVSIKVVVHLVLLLLIVDGMVRIITGLRRLMAGLSKRILEVGHGITHGFVITNE